MTNEVEVRVSRLDGSCVFAGWTQFDQTVGSLLASLNVPAGSVLTVAAVPVLASSLLADHIGNDGCVNALLAATTQLEVQKGVRCWILPDMHSTQIFIPSDVKDPVASINTGMRERLGAACHLDVSPFAVKASGEGPSLRELALCSFMQSLTLIVEGREALELRLEEIEIAPERLLEELKVEYGESNPSRCYTSAKVFQKEVSYSTYAGLWSDDPVFDPFGPVDRANLPLWRPHFSRWGVGHIRVDDGRIIESGGSYEDSCDPTFCVFNDIAVQYTDGRIPELYTYPPDVFPPTDDHACLQVENHVYLLGNGGYPEDLPDSMQILRLDLGSYEVQRIDTKGQGPRWLSKSHMVHSIGKWKFGASGCCPGWHPPQDINLTMKCCWNHDDERAEGYVGGLFFGVVVRLNEFRESFRLMSQGGCANDTFLVKEAEFPQGAIVLTTESFVIVEDCYNTNSWIVAKIDETLGVVYQAAHYVQAGMILDLDRDRAPDVKSAEDDADDKDGFSAPRDIRVRRADASFCGFLRGRRSMEEHSGLQLADQFIPESDNLDEVTSLTPPRIVEAKFVDDITGEDRMNMCLYRPLALFLAEAAVKQAEADLQEDARQSCEEILQAARARLAEVIDQVLFLAPAEKELAKEVMLDAQDAWQAALVKWGLTDDTKPNPRLEGRNIVIEIYPGPTCWHLNVDNFEWHEAGS
eukprot:TRINITY_DN65515_c0_g1_i1.p1 TRINITY_DN65515_c0_g1~~TRINITY_DN65515_c0_g1_i1.p1  ORF type:complete len:696 (+),score=89.15 TRINITY_DN65515_c0_g1_i1:71-2158(+)